MISYLRGKVKLARWGMVILDVNGVGYKINVNPQIGIPENIVDTGENIELFIHEHIREDIDEFYGFLEYQELELFQRLISVNGVGPKAAMNIMSSAPSDRIISAIQSEDISFFTSISGIGKKAATKIILDLKGKISIEDAGNILSTSGDSSDVLDAMATLGYKKADIAKFVRDIPESEKTSEQKIKWLLKNIGKK